MPTLTLDTSPGLRRGASQEPQSGSISPPHPPYSPITPTLSSARFATPSDSAGQGSGNHRQTFRHFQPQQEAVSFPPLESIDFENNPDVLAIKATASILQLQGARAASDIKTLNRTKKQALADPEEFARALYAGGIRSAGDPLFYPKQDDQIAEGDDEEQEDTAQSKPDGVDTKFERLPGPQNVVRMPSINWAQYAVVGDSLDKLHQDQLARPTDGVPQRVGTNGQLIPGNDGTRRQAGLGVGAPYQPGKDKIEKVIPKKGGKR